MIPMSEVHLRAILNEWVAHYNRGRPHSSLGPGVPDPPQPAALFPKSKSRHELAADAFVHVKSVLAGLHHEYSLAAISASA
jgi:putative transposase